MEMGVRQGPAFPLLSSCSQDLEKRWGPTVRSPRPSPGEVSTL